MSLLLLVGIGFGAACFASLIRREPLTLAHLCVGLVTGAIGYGASRLPAMAVWGPALPIFLVGVTALGLSSIEAVEG
jgi:hypothetical protein